MPPKIFVCQPIPDAALDHMREHGDVEIFPFSHRAITVAELESAARRSDYIFCMHETPITASMCEANPQLKGYALGKPEEGIHDVAACEAYGIPMLLSSQIEDRDAVRLGNGNATADLMVALLLSCAYRVVEADRYSRRYRWFQEMTMDLMGVGCTGKTVSIIGMGRVATCAAPRLKALQMNVLYTKRTRLTPDEEAELGLEWVDDMDELIARADYVSMLANYEPANYKMFGAREFALMKPTAYFINVGRGRLVDEEAMIQALRDGTIAGAGLDVYYDEPPVVVEPRIPDALIEMENVVLQPHNGGATWDSRSRQTLGIARAITMDIEQRAAQEAGRESLV